MIEDTGGGEMMFPGWQGDSGHESALEAWRSAAWLVRERWADFLAADGASRADAFAAYVAALDGEEVAAAMLADRQLAVAA
jgi:hypothetical protein